ncbi:MAG: hypothetical protein ACLU9S_10100 [Oscillospiraceae bacterium]
MFFTRMLYSCSGGRGLDTEAFMAGQPRAQDCGASMDALWDKLRRFIAGWFPPKGELNRQRCAILSGAWPRGNSGAGAAHPSRCPPEAAKTVASLAFALRPRQRRTA